MCVEISSYNCRVSFVYIVVSKVFQGCSIVVRRWCVRLCRGFGGVIGVDQMDEYVVVL
jgi:hypothetical protein